MPVKPLRRPTKSSALAFVVLLSLAGCAGATTGKVTESYAAGLEYGQQLAEMAPTTQTPTSRCALAISNGLLHDLRTGKVHPTGYNDAEFIDGCTAAVTAE